MTLRLMLLSLISALYIDGLPSPSQQIKTYELKSNEIMFQFVGADADGGARLLNDFVFKVQTNYSLEVLNEDTGLSRLGITGFQYTFRDIRGGQMAFPTYQVVSNPDNVYYFPITDNYDFFWQDTDFQDIAVHNIVYDFDYDIDTNLLSVTCSYVNNNSVDVYKWSSNAVIPLHASISRADILDGIEQLVLPMSNYTDTIHAIINKSSTYQSGFNQGYNNGYDNGLIDGYNNGYNEGLILGNETGYNEGLNVGYTNGYVDGYNEGVDADSTAVAIFSGILSIAMVPINFFLSIFNFEILGINMSTFVSALLTVCVIIIVLKTITGKGKE